MSEENAVIKGLVQRYVKNEVERFNKIKTDYDVIDIESKKTINKILKKYEIHKNAEDLIIKEMYRYRNDLYTYSKKIAQNELEQNIITSAHVNKAIVKLSNPKNQNSLIDIFLTMGGLFLGCTINHLFEISNTPSNINLYIVVLGIFGSLFLGMGILGKIKK